jgi:cytochrome bd ubiquinol oxidase subunit II
MDTYSYLQITWYFIIGFLLVGYSVLDGFDLGIGALMPLLAGDEGDRKSLLDAIGPFWDGNEVWLITAGAALFAAFPHAYATVFSGFYLALMLVLFSLIFRAVSTEFYHHDEKRRGLWAAAFTVGSFVPSLLFGVALGNVIIGVPLDGSMEFRGDFFTLLRPYPLALGLLGLSAIGMQGSAYAAMKTAGGLQDRARLMLRRTGIFFIAMLLVSFIATVVYLPGALKGFLIWVPAVVVVSAWIAGRIYSSRGRDGMAFAMTSLCFAGLWGMAGAAHFPNLVKAANDPALSITIGNGSSSELTLSIMLVIALVGMPLVLYYTGYAYRALRKA